MKTPRHPMPADEEGEVCAGSNLKLIPLPGYMERIVSAIPTDHLAQQIERLWLQQARWRASVDAMSHVLDVLIATHPKPEAVKELLQQSRPGLVDELIDGREKSKYRETILEEFQLRLRHYDEVVETTIKLR